MAFVQAYRRNKTYRYELPDATLVFEPNEKGDVVCDVADQSAVDKLLLTPTGFRLYGDQHGEISPVLTAKVSLVTLTEPENTKDAQETCAYVLRNDDEVLDLRPMSDAELHSFAQVNGIKVHHNAKGDTIRDKIVDFFKSEG